MPWIKTAVASCFVIACVQQLGCVVDAGGPTKEDVAQQPYGKPVPPACESDDPCLVAALGADGLCEETAVPGCAACESDGIPGTSRDGGECCTTCWAGSTCYRNPNEDVCGGGGNLCVVCTLYPACVNGACAFPQD
jgi:hypothetical protein